MRVLFDQGVPAPLRHHLPGHEVRTAFEHGWSVLTNGDLLTRAEGSGFDVLVTTDRNVRFQQNLTGRRIAIVVISTTSWRRIRSSAELVGEAVGSASPGTLIEVQIP